jgi:hypothetical protein
VPARQNPGIAVEGIGFGTYLASGDWRYHCIDERLAERGKYATYAKAWSLRKKNKIRRRSTPLLHF